MKYCSHCGKELVDEAVVCPNCGCAAEMQTPPPPPPEAQKSEMADVLRLIAKIFMIIGCVSFGAALIPLAWSIPMTVHYWRCVRDGRSVGLGFKICSLIFVNTVAGILMIVSDDLK